MGELFELPPFMTRQIVAGPITLPFTLLGLIVEFILPALTVGLLLLVLFVVLRRVARRLNVKDETRDRILRWLRRGTRLAWIVSILGLGSRILGAELARWTGVAFRVINQPFFTTGNTEISVVTLILVIPVFYLAGWSSRATRQMMEQVVVKRLHLDTHRALSVMNVTRFAVMGITLIVGLSVIGINLSSLAVLFGVLGIGVGFGLQDAVGNMFAGLIIIFSRPIKEGDRVLVDDIEGTVQQIKLIHTVINTVTHETIIIPNSKIVGNAMHNYSYDDVRIIMCNSVQVSYGSDLERVGTVLLEVGRRNPWRAPGEEPRYRVWSFDDSGITVRLCTWIRDATDRIDAFSWTNLEIWRAFRDNGIEIPFPQMDLHVKAVPGSVAGTLSEQSALPGSDGPELDAKNSDTL